MSFNMLNLRESLLFSDPQTTVTLEYYNSLKRVKLTSGCLLTGCQLCSDMLNHLREAPVDYLDQLSAVALSYV